MCCVFGVALTACSNHPSLLDDLDHQKAKAANDPWAVATGDPSKSDDDDGGMGFDLKGMLQKIGETIDKPGPYEAPEKSADFDETKPHWAVLDVGGGIVEREAYSFSLFGGAKRGTELRKLVERLRGLATDDDITGVMLRMSSLEISLPDVIELRAAMHDLRAAKKHLACHVEEASNATYLVLAACERIGIAPLGQVAITGPAAMPIHLKGLLDRVGVQADFIHVGAYKGAAEPLTRDAPSPEMQETINAILDRHYDTMVDVIGKERGIDAATVKGLIDTALFASEAAKSAKLVDDVVSFEDFRAAQVKAPWTEIELDEQKLGKGDQLSTMMKIARFLGAMPPEKPAGDHVAVIYALGNIVDGDGSGVLGARQEIASHTLVSALRAIAADDSVKAVVLRIDSGGGSAQASELIWQAVRDLRAKKPVVVSMSDVAASGGYYIASGATKIFALDDTLTGSIGVVGGKIAPGPALAKLGVTTFPMGRGKRATIMASFQPWTAEEKAVIQKSMEEVYGVFVGRVADGRKQPLDKVKQLAQGRVWTGAKAKELGLVDEIGGLDAALAEARKLGKVDATVALEVYPPSPTLRDFVQGFGEVQTPFGLRSELAAISAIHPQLGDAAARLVDLVLSFQHTQIQAVAVLPVVR
ncbi:MAG TPA: signal peptide peptidase SppA [Kofleriaceae bacterium]|nr:signal peptide peptidase SppA [Kofleriaceae bacterium]